MFVQPGAARIHGAVMADHQRWRPGGEGRQSLEFRHADAAAHQVVHMRIDPGKPPGADGQVGSRQAGRERGAVVVIAGHAEQRPVEVGPQRGKKQLVGCRRRALGDVAGSEHCIRPTLRTRGPQHRIETGTCADAQQRCAGARKKMAVRDL